jgi:hypothetical protein
MLQRRFAALTEGTKVASFTEESNLKHLSSVKETVDG